jgi:hypothetical protein
MNNTLPYINPVSPISIQSVADGTAWRSQAAFVERVVGEDGQVKEVVEGPGVMRHSALKFELKLILNMDW